TRVQHAEEVIIRADEDEQLVIRESGNEHPCEYTMLGNGRRHDETIKRFERTSHGLLRVPVDPPGGGAGSSAVLAADGKDHRLDVLERRFILGSAVQGGVRREVHDPERIPSLSDAHPVDPRPDNIAVGQARWIRSTEPGQGEGLINLELAYFVVALYG